MEKNVKDSWRFHLNCAYNTYKLIRLQEDKFKIQINGSHKKDNGDDVEEG